MANKILERTAKIREELLCRLEEKVKEDLPVSEYQNILMTIGIIEQNERKAESDAKFDEVIKGMVGGLGVNPFNKSENPNSSDTLLKILDDGDNKL